MISILGEKLDGSLFLEGWGGGSFIIMGKYLGSSSVGGRGGGGASPAPPPLD